MTTHDDAMCPDCTCPSGACDRHVSVVEQILNLAEQQPPTLADVLARHAPEDGHRETYCACGEPTGNYNSTFFDHLAAVVEQHHAAEVTRLRDEQLAFTDRLGFGNDRTEPAATLEQMIDPIERAFSDAHEHHECPVICEPCGETLASATCEHCYGSGCGPGTASGAYSECEWCAGVGKVHPGCVEQSYADLAAENQRLCDGLTSLLADLAKAEPQHFSIGLMCVRLRALLNPTERTEGA